jgi:hypothetical protein
MISRRIFKVREGETPSPTRETRALPRRESLKPAELPEPAQGQLHLGPFQPMTAHEMFEAHALETGAAHVCGHLTFQRDLKSPVLLVGD